MKLAFLGDIALFGCFDINRNKDLKENLREISSYLEKFDLVVGNLESPFSIKKKTNGAKSAYVCSEVENIEVLKRLHIDVVNLANNHIFDYGNEGYSVTKDLLDKYGIEYFGTENKSFYYIKDSEKLCFSGYCCYSTNPLNISERPNQCGINRYNLNDVKNDMKKNSNNGFFNIISVHAGLEHVNYPSIEHIRASRYLAQICPYFYYGHHPHVIQGVESYSESLIAHSLGNFCFDDVYTKASGSVPLVTLSKQNRSGLIMELEIIDNKIVNWKEQPIYIHKDGKITIEQDENTLVEYNSSLKNCEQNINLYNQNRLSILRARQEQRKSMRSFSWFIKRLRFRYLKLILDMRTNRKMYYNNVIKYI